MRSNGLNTMNEISKSIQKIKAEYEERIDELIDEIFRLRMSIHHKTEDEQIDKADINP